MTLPHTRPLKNPRLVMQGNCRETTPGNNLAACRVVGARWKCRVLSGYQLPAALIPSASSNINSRRAVLALCSPLYLWQSSPRCLSIMPLKPPFPLPFFVSPSFPSLHSFRPPLHPGWLEQFLWLLMPPPASVGWVKDGTRTLKPVLKNVALPQNNQW